ncbi:homing endonuclease [Salmonella phage Se-J]|uniref:homing endonuclease n=1 Tax=Salmonella phage Se-J TaxID=2698910 RepID=UPI0018B002C3|nr:homing endonuclease [Salmonella phage Se-J]
MNGIIYLLRVNGQPYVGQTRKSFQQRLSEHLSEARRGNKTYLYNAIRKYGEESVTYEILEECPVEYLNDREIFYIDSLEAHFSKGGLNILKGGQIDISGMAAAYDIDTKEFVGMRLVSDPGWNVSFVHIMKGRKLSEDTRKKMVESQAIAWSEEKRLSHSETLKNAYQDPIHKENLRRAMDKVRSNPMFQEKINKSLGGLFILTTPDGRSQEVKNLIRFCEQNGLCIETFNMVLAGRKDNPVPKPYRKSSDKRTNTTGWKIERK